MTPLFSIYMPYFIYMAITFNVIFLYFGISHLYVLAILVGIVGMLFDGVKKNTRALAVYMYLAVLFFVFILNILIFEELLGTINSFIMYSLMLIYWLIYFNTYTIFMFKQVLLKTIPLVYIVAFLAFIQYFYSPNLFGLLNIVASTNIEWATGKPFNEYSIFFRATSVLGSPQVFGLFMSLYFIIIFSMRANKNMLDYICLIFVFVAGGLSGNKSFFLIIIFFLLYKFFQQNFKKKLKWIILFLLLGVIVSSVSFTTIQNISIINRIVNPEEISRQEHEDSRVQRYIKTVISTNPLIGNGLGSKTNKNDKVEAAESYFLQLYYEAGLISLIFFLFLLLISYTNSSKLLIKDIKILILLMTLSMIIVHAFDSPFFFIFWGIISASFAYKNKTIFGRSYIND